MASSMRRARGVPLVEFRIHRESNVLRPPSRANGLVDRSGRKGSRARPLFRRARPKAVVLPSATFGREERTSEERKHSGQRLLGIQSWMALPEAQEESDPAFVHHAAQELPGIEGDGIRARVIAGEVLGARSPLITPSETVYAHLDLRAGARMPVEPSFEERAVYTLKGEIEIAGDTFGPGQLLVLRPGDQIVVTATSDAEFMLFGGAPMGGPRYIWWNFVSSRVERIEQAKEEWAQGRFDTVPGDAEEFIPLPQTKDKPRRATGGVFYP